MNLNNAIIILMIGLTVSGCQESDNAGTQVRTGRFVDGPVAGLQYETPTQSGTTSNKGEFQYIPGESVRFYLGNTELGSVPAQALVTPMQLVANGDSQNTQVLNRVRFLMLLDSDGESNNGITISQASADFASTFNAIDFDSEDQQGQLSGFINAIAVAESRTPILPDLEQAQAHLTQSVLCEFGGLYIGTYSGDAAGTWSMVLDYDTGIISGIGRNTDIDGERFSGYGQMTIDANQTVVAGVTYGGGDNVIITTDYAALAEPAPVVGVPEQEYDANWQGNINAEKIMSGAWQDGNVSGTFMGERQIQSPIATGVNYRGVYSGDDLLNANDFGVFTLAVDEAGNVSGGGFTIKGQAEIFFSGTQVGDDFNLIVTTSNGEGATMSATLNGNVISGMWSGNQGNSQGSMSACRIQ